MVDKHVSAGIGLLGSLVMVVLAGCPKPLAFLKRLSLINTFLIFIWLVLPFSFSIPGRAVLTVGPLTMTYEGLHLTSLLSVKAIGITAAAMAITLSTGIFELMTAARSLGAPAKLMAMMALMTRYVNVVGAEFDRLVWAMRIRGFTPKATIHCLKSYANLAGMMLVRGIDRAERVHAAMLCRGYRGQFFFEGTFKLTRLDLYISLTVLGLGLTVIATNVW
jgi:cobalt/nickel transport system permease protein